VLLLGMAAEAVAFAACVALERAGSVRFRPLVRSVLLECLSCCEDREESLLGVGEDSGLGPVRLIASAEVALLDRELQPISRDAFSAAWAPATELWPPALGALTRAELEREGELELAAGHFERLREFVHSAAERGLGLMVHHW
jgi:hypothetical protein